MPNNPDKAADQPATSGGTLPTDHGCLPDWDTGDLPEPLPFSLGNVVRTIGPGAILLAGSIGGGEWIIGPLMAVEHGRGILWIATVAILLQLVFNMEAVRYTMYTGEPILTGIMRLRPGRWLWGPFYIALAIGQLGAPALAGGCAAVVFSAVAGRLPTSDDQFAAQLLTIGIVISGVVVLLSGKSVERLLERLSWFMVSFIFLFLLIANVVFVPLADWGATLSGFVNFGHLPADMDLLLLSAFAATAGSGGLGNIAISNWFRDKGFGMGKHVGGIGGALAHGGHVELASVGRVFPTNEMNLHRWHTWWRYALVDQSVLWCIGCGVGMFLNVNLATAIFPDSTQLEGVAVGAFQAEFMAKAWQGFWVLALLNGFWILYSTHLGNTDVLVRTISDVLWAGFPRVQRWSASRIYAFLLVGMAVWGFYAVNWGHAKRLLEILGAVANVVLVLGAVQILRVNHRFLPRAVRPPWWRSALLVLCALFYGTIAAALMLKQFDLLKYLGIG